MERRGVVLLAGLALLSALACDLSAFRSAGPVPKGPETPSQVTPSQPPPSPSPVGTGEGIPPKPPSITPPAPTALNLPLRVYNPLDTARTDQSVVSGVPLPRESGINDPARLRLVDAAGNPTPAQFTVLARWDSSLEDHTAPIRSILVTFQAAVGPQSTAYYFLQEAAPDDTPAQPPAIRDSTGDLLTPTLHLPLAYRDHASLDVTLTVNNPLTTARIGEPVTSGVPVPREAHLTDLDCLRLLDDSGQPVAAQFTPLARWGSGPEDVNQPIRWLLVDFQADVAANDTAGRLLSASYRLVNSGGLHPTYPTMIVTDTASAITVNVGDAEFRIRKTDGGLFGPHMAAPLVGRVMDGDGTVHNTTGPVTVTMPLSGPMRVSVHVQGAYRDAEGAPLLDYTSHYWFFAGQPNVRLFHTVENNTSCPLTEDAQLDCYDIGSGGSVTVRDLSLVLTTDLGGSLTYSAAGEGTPASGRLTSDLALYQDSSGTDAWDTYPTMTDWEGNPLDTRPRMQSYVTFRGYRTTLGSAIVDSGDHATGWLSVAGADGGWTVGVHDFWQNFPKALRAVPDGTIEIGLFPDEFGPADYGFSLRAGEHKTHEILLSPTSTPPNLDTLFASAPPAWYVQSGALGPTALPNWSNWPDHEQYVVHQLDTSPDHDGWDDYFDNIRDAIASTDLYGIFDYGDWPIDYEGYEVAPLNCKYDNDYGMWLQWMRSGDPRWFDLAEAADRHFADVDILHNRHSPRHWGDGIAFGHSYHDEDGFINPHRNHGGNHPDTAFGMNGMLLAYYLTGYEKAHQSALELADCIEYRLRNDSHLCDYFPECSGEGYGLGESDGLYETGCRPAANSLSIAVAAYRATADPRYLAVADAVVDWAQAENQPYLDGPTGEDRMMRPWMLNMYLRALADYLEVRDEFGLPDAFGAQDSFLAYADWLRTYPWLDLDPIETGPRAAYPYEWWFDGRTVNDEASINNWLLLGADSMAYAYHLSGEDDYLARAAALFRTGSRDPWFEGDPNIYAECKETINSITFGHRFLYEWAQRR